MGNFDAIEHPPKKPSMEIKNPRKSTIHGATERTDKNKFAQHDFCRVKSRSVFRSRFFPDKNLPTKIRLRKHSSSEFSAKIYFGRHIASGLYLFSGFHSKLTNERSIWSAQMQVFKHMVGRSKRLPSGHPLRQQ